MGCKNMWIDLLYIFSCAAFGIITGWVIGWVVGRLESRKYLKKRYEHLLSMLDDLESDK
jgi:Na+/glutamate symporter